MKFIYCLFILIFSSLIAESNERDPFNLFAAQKERVEKEDFSLKGIAQFKDKYGGIIEIGGESKIVFVGENINGYEVKSISKGGVVLCKNNETINLGNG